MKSPARPGGRYGPSTRSETDGTTDDRRSRAGHGRDQGAVRRGEGEDGLDPQPDQGAKTGSDRELRSTESAMSDNTETAILAGGCFWGVQELLRRREGVISTRVGYTGGGNDNPTYRHHPGHAEAVEIVFHPQRISYRDIPEFFFQIHDPTTKDRQGNDFGSDYRSEIFFLSDEQRRVAEDTIADLNA